MAYLHSRADGSDSLSLLHTFGFMIVKKSPLQVALFFFNFFFKKKPFKVVVLCRNFLH